MPPIPVHIDDPITPQKAEAITPKTATSGAAVGVSPASNPATTTAAASSPAAYPQARPGAAAVPAPTPYTPPQPTRTQQPVNQNAPPPPPQPGAVPVPPSQQAPRTATSTLPPPPKAGESVQQRQTSMPAQMNIPPPQQNYAPSHSTSPYQSSPTQQPTTLNLGPVAHGRGPSSEFPPGYRQNSYAQDLSPAQRSSLEQQERKESLGANTAGGMNWEGGNEVVNSAWSAVKGWVGAAGEKLAETEESVWNRINGGQK